MSACMCVPGLKDARRGARSFGLELQTPYGCWELNPGTLQGKQVLLIAKPSLLPLKNLLIGFFVLLSFLLLLFLMKFH